MCATGAGDASGNSSMRVDRRALDGRRDCSGTRSRESRHLVAGSNRAISRRLGISEICVRFALALGTNRRCQKIIESEIDSESGRTSKKSRIRCVHRETAVRVVETCVTRPSSPWTHYRTDTSIAVAGRPPNTAGSGRACTGRARGAREKTPVDRRRWSHHHGRLRP